MIDFRSTRPGVDAVHAAYLRLCAAVVYQAIQDVTIRWKKPEKPQKAFAMVAAAREGGEYTEVELTYSRGKVRRYYDDLKRADEYERNAKSGMTFLLGRANGLDGFAGIIGFDADDFRSALLYGEDNPKAPGAFSSHGLVRFRAERWGFKPEQWKPGVKWSW